MELHSGILRLLGIHQGMALRVRSGYPVPEGGSMNSKETGFEGLLSLGGRRHISPVERERKASGYFSPKNSQPGNDFAEAIRKLSAEDEEMPVPDGPGPIIFKDGIFQIDVANTCASADIDPALKGLIDSILG